MLSPNNMSMKGKTIILANPSILNQKGVILRTVGPSGNTVYQQISGLSGHTIIQQQGGGPPSLIKSNDQQSSTSMQQLPALIPTNQNIPSLTPVMIQQSSSSGGQQQKGISTLINQHTLPQQTIIRPVQGGQMTLIQRPGQQAQLVQTISQPGQSQQATQRIIMAQPQSSIQIQQVPQTPAPTIQIQQIQPIVVQQNQQQQQQQPATQAQGTRKGLSLSNIHILEAHDMFKKANRVTRLEKAIILAFMAGYRDNPRPNPDNVVVIKLNESKVSVFVLIKKKNYQNL
jgi:negative elongation factor A